MRTPSSFTIPASRSSGPINSLGGFGIRLFGSILVAGSLLGQSANAATYYWDTNGTAAGPGTVPSGAWTVGSNWNTDVTGGASGTLGTAPTSADDAYFAAGPTGATGSYTVSLGGASVAVNRISFNSTVGVTIGSSVGDGTITLGTGGIAASGTGNGAVATVNSNISLNGDQSWASGQGGNPNGFLVTGAIGGTGNLTYANNTGRAAIFSGAVNHAGFLSLIGTGAGTTTISGDIGSNVTNLSNIRLVVLTGNNSYTGTTQVTGGNSATATLRIGSSTALPTGTVVTLNSSTVKSSARLELGNGTSSYNVSVAGLLSASGRQGLSVVTNVDSTAAFAHTGTITVTPSGTNDFSGLIQDGTTSRVGVAMAGTGTLTLSGVNAYTGGTTVSSGTLISKADVGQTTNLTVSTLAVGTATQTATVASSAGLAVGQVISAANFSAGTYIIGISGTTISLSSTATATGTNSTVFSGYQTLGSGAVTATGTGVLDLNGSATSPVGAVTVSGGTIQNGTLTGTSYALTGSGMVSAALAGNGALTKSGAGTATLSGANTYSGGTVISGGTLLVASSTALQGATGSAAVNSGGTLSSNVTSANLGGALTLAGGTVTADGSSVGSFTLASGSSFSMTSGILELTLAGAGSFDQIFGSGAGTFTLSGGILDLTGSVTDYTASYQILSGFTSGSVSGLSFINYDTANYTASMNNSGVLSFTAVPEPSTYALLASGLGALFFLSRPARKKA